MRFAVSILMLGSVLVARTSAHADALPVRHRIVIERCFEPPMSLALAIAEHEASRALTPRSLSSNGEQVVATPAPMPRVEARPAVQPVQPFSPIPRVCSSPDEPGCRVSSQPPASPRSQFAHVAYGVVASFPVPEVPRAGACTASLSALVQDAPTQPHRAAPWRPPAR